MKIIIHAFILALATLASADDHIHLDVKTDCSVGSSMCSFEHSIGLCGKHQTCMQALLAKLQGMNQTQIFDADETIACVGRPGLVGELCIAGYVNYILDDGSGSPVFKDGFSAQDAANSTQALINAGCTTCGISILNSTLSDFDLEDPQQTDTVIISIDGYAVDYRAQIFQG